MRRKVENSSSIIPFVVYLRSKKRKEPVSQLGFPFLNGNLKNTFIFNFQLSILNSACIREK